MSRKTILRERAQPLKRTKQTTPPKKPTTTNAPSYFASTWLLTGILLWLRYFNTITWTLAIILYFTLSAAAGKLALSTLLCTVFFVVTGIDCVWFWFRALQTIGTSFLAWSGVIVMSHFDQNIFIFAEKINTRRVQGNPYTLREFYDEAIALAYLQGSIDAPRTHVDTPTTTSSSSQVVSNPPGSRPERRHASTLATTASDLRPTPASISSSYRGTSVTNTAMNSARLKSPTSREVKSNVISSQAQSIAGSSSTANVAIVAKVMDSNPLSSSPPSTLSTLSALNDTQTSAISSPPPATTGSLSTTKVIAFPKDATSLSSTAVFKLIKPSLPSLPPSPATSIATPRVIKIANPDTLLSLPESPAGTLTTTSIVSTSKVETPLTPPQSPQSTLSILSATTPPSSARTIDKHIPAIATLITPTTSRSKGKQAPPITPTFSKSNIIDLPISTPTRQLLPYHPRGYLSPTRIAKKLNNWYCRSEISRPVFIDPPNLIELCPTPAYCKSLRATSLFAACDHSLVGMFEKALEAEGGVVKMARKMRGWRSLWDVDLWEEQEIEGEIGELMRRKVRAVTVVVELAAERMGL